MNRRRRMLGLLALLPASLGAGVVGYWLYTSQPPNVSEEDLAFSLATSRNALSRSYAIDSTPSIDVSSLGSSTTAQSSTAALSEPSALPTDENLAHETQLEIEDAQAAVADELQEAGLNPSAFSGSSTFGSGTSGGDGYSRRASFGHGGGGAAGGGGGGGSSKPASSASANNQSVNAIDVESGEEQHAGAEERYIEDPQAYLAGTLPHEASGSCQSLSCSQPQDVDGKGGPRFDGPNNDFDSKPHVSVPEPGSLGLLGVGLLGVLASQRRRQKP